MDSLKKVIKLKSELDSFRPLDKDVESALMQKFKLEWNYHSNNLEGNSLTYGETKALILFGITAQGKPLKDHFEMSGHNQALNWIFEIINQKRPLTESFIRQLHELILKESYKVKAITPDGKPTQKIVKIGQCKTTPNHVKTRTGEIFRFASPEETPAMMNSLIDWYRKEYEKKDSNPILLASQFHYKFVKIHPFDDGNGRTARILMNFILMQHGFPPAIIKTEEKAGYLRVLEQADAGIFEPFLDFIAKNLIQSLQLIIKAAKGESIEEPDDIDKELSILEQKLKSKDRPIRKGKSLDSMLYTFENSFVPLAKKFIEKAEKFEQFYFESHLRIYHGESFNEKLNNVRSALDKNTSSIIIVYSYNHFNIEGIETFNYESEVHIYFSKISYLVHNRSEEIKIEKLYSQDLNPSEINEIVNSEIRRHKEFIESKIEN
jgi:Fic family protein